VHNEAPPKLYDPAAQATHDVAPVVETFVPAGQGVQAVALPSEYEPARHFVPAAESDGQEEPA
jgi:hypothetical protein